MNVLLGEPRKHTEAEIVAFETRMGVRLPSSYRQHLMTVGGGCLTSSKVDLLEDWAQPFDVDGLPPGFLQQVFPHVQAWNDRSLLRPELGWNSPYYDSSLICGSMRVKSTGCEGYDLLVVSGPEAGNMWHDDRACGGKGIYPLKDLSGQTLTAEQYLQDSFHK